MGKRTKLSSIDLTKVSDAVGRGTQCAIKFVGDHKVAIIGLIVAIGDNIRVRLKRKKDRKAFEESSVKQQTVARKHEAEINALRQEAEQAKEAGYRIDVLEQIVKNITERGGNE